MSKQNVAIQADMHVLVAKAWEVFTSPEYITRWNHASDEWHCPSAENDLQVGGKFNYRMEAKDGSFGFDFWGIYTDVKEHKLIAYTMGDDRKATVLFSEQDGITTVTTTFEIEDENTAEMQRQGWQAILDNFKRCAEAAE